MANQQILVRLPDDAAAKLRAAVPARQRNKLIAELVEAAVVRHEDELAKIAALVTGDEKRNPEFARETDDWEANVSDGAFSGPRETLDDRDLLN